MYKYLRLKQQVEKTEWLPEKGKWKVTLQDLGNSQVGGSVENIIDHDPDTVRPMKRNWTS